MNNNQSKVKINESQIGAVGKTVKVEGGIHYHYHRIPVSNSDSARLL